MAPPPPSRPLGKREFARLMAAFGPFESAPAMAAGVSGGADSLALALLLDDWCREAGGSFTALTVDHGLRPESAAESRALGQRLGALGIAHRILPWRPAEPPQSNVQARAREARYELMSAWCARRGVLHLVLAHHLDDQAETLLLRLARGSGLHGLTAMAPLTERDALRVLRPLLDIPRARLEATLAARKIAWIDDPANRDRRFARARLRELMPALAAEGLDPSGFGRTCTRLGRARLALEAVTAEIIAGAATLHPAGFLRLDKRRLLAAPEEVGLRVLAAVCTTIGGQAQPPRLARLRRLYGTLAAGSQRPATLGGCRLVPEADGLLVVRETRQLPRAPLVPGARLLWDGRFTLRAAHRPAPPGRLSLGPLGAAGWAAVKSSDNSAKTPHKPLIPRLSALSSPALFDSRGLREAPLLGYRRVDQRRPALEECRFTPLRGLSAAAFTVV